MPRLEPVLILRYSLRGVLVVSRAAATVDRILFTGLAGGAARLPYLVGSSLSRVQSGSLTEYLLLVFTGIALLVLARLFA
ncbi:MAG TPA: hypothetical protein VGR66_09725 [Candidatus Eisenbacteria bacterium]|nr:hypothetical protein [Candidatus Eisenbacteria bacterium]